MGFADDFKLATRDQVNELRPKSKRFPSLFGVQAQVNVGENFENNEIIYGDVKLNLDVLSELSYALYDVVESMWIKDTEANEVVISFKNKKITFAELLSIGEAYNEI